jgi:hypothetical protein
MKNILFSFLIISIKLIKINSLYIYIKGKEKGCVKKYKKQNEVINIIYSISGMEDYDRNIITVDNSDDFNMFRELDSSSNKIYLFIEKDGYHKFCVENLASHGVTLSFHFAQENSEDKLSIENVENFVENVNKLSNKMETIKFNIGHSAVNKKNHRKILENIREQINIYSLIKIIFVLFFSIIQIGLITNIFNKATKTKKIKLNEEENNPLKNKNNDKFQEIFNSKCKKNEL